MAYDFDLVINRKKSGSVKWDKYAGSDIIPLWVADMDFRSPPGVTKALKQHADHAIFGYTHPSSELTQTVIHRLRKLYSWQIQPNWLVWLPGLVSGINAVCRSFGRPGNDIMTTTPVYPPFLTAPGYSDRSLITVPMIEKNRRMTLDFNKIEASITEKTDLFILCNPYNPCGTVFTKDELNQLAALFTKHDVIILSDEIHADFILDQKFSHIPTATLSKGAAERCITLMAPSKSFNIPGLGCSFAVIQNPRLRNALQKSARGILPHINALGLTAAQAAYDHGDEWLEQLIVYLRGNRDLLIKEINQIKGMTLFPIAATYLAWIDVRGLGLMDPAEFFETHGVGLSDGREFGAKGFVRLNFGCSRLLLKKAIGRIKKAVSNLPRQMPNLGHPMKKTRSNTI